jgi:hypothetical protein
VVSQQDIDVLMDHSCCSKAVLTNNHNPCVTHQLSFRIMDYRLLSSFFICACMIANVLIDDVSRLLSSNGRSVRR